MIVPVTTNGRPCLALAISRINTRADVKALRDALRDAKPRLQKSRRASRCTSCLT